MLFIVYGLRDLRKRKGLTGGEAAEILGISRRALEKYESSGGERSFNFIIVDKLATVYDASYTEVIYACHNKDIDERLICVDSEAENLKELRELAGLTPVQAYTKLEITKSTLFRYEKAHIKPTSIIIYKMHQVYKVSCEDLVNACFKTFGVKKFQNIL